MGESTYDPGITLVVLPQTTLEAFRAVAQTLGFSFDRREGDPDDLEHDYSEYWVDAAKSASIAWLHRPGALGTFLRFRGANAERYVADVSRLLFTLDAQSVIMRARGQPDHDSLVLLLHFVPATHPEATPDAVSVLREGLRDERRNIRMAALNAWSAVEWDELRTDVEKLANEDPDDGVKAFAQRLLGWTNPS